MAQPLPDPVFSSADGYFHSPEAAAAHAVHVQHGFTTPAREARRMVRSSDPIYKAMGRAWLRDHGLPEHGDQEPPGWEHWQQDWWGTQQHPANEAAPPRQVTIDHVTPGSRLESLFAQYDEAKAQLTTAEERMKTIKAGVEDELRAAYPKTSKFDIPAGPGWPDLQLYYSEPRYFDTKQFQRDQPDVYEKYRKPRPGWTFGKPQKKKDER